MPLSAALVVIVVVGTKGANITRDYPTNIRITPMESGLTDRNCVSRFSDPLLGCKRFPAVRAGKISGQTFERVEATLRYCLGL